MPGTVKTHAKCALGHRLVDAGRSVRSPQPTAWCKNYSSPNATCICPVGCANWTTSTSCSLTTWATCPMAPKSPRSSSLLYLDFGSGRTHHLQSTGCGRPVYSWSKQTADEQGLPQPFPIDPEQLPGPIEPVSRKEGTASIVREVNLAYQSNNIGIDLSTASIDVAVRPEGIAWQADYDEAGIDDLISRLARLNPAAELLEATGGLELPLDSALAVSACPWWWLIPARNHGQARLRQSHRSAHRSARCELRRPRNSTP